MSLRQVAERALSDAQQMRFRVWLGDVANSRHFIFISRQRIRNRNDAHKSVECGQGPVVKRQTVDSCGPPRGRAWHKALLSQMPVPNHSG